MERKGFLSQSPGRLVPTVGGQLAFVPDPLPPEIVWDDALVTSVFAAARALGELSGLGSDLPNPHLLIRPFVRREAVLSSQIEGTQASLSQLLLFEVRQEVQDEVPDVLEVSNYVRALEYGLGQLSKFPLSLRLIRDMHAILMRGVRGDDRLPGEFRRTQVHIGPEGTGIGSATFVPAPPSELTAALDLFEKYLHAPSNMPPVVRLAITHYQFEAIHPFMDGNGRIGRLLISLMLCWEGILPLPLLYLSAYFHRTREEYYRRLLDVSQKGDWSGWINYFAGAIACEAKDAVERTRRLKKLRAQYIEMIQTPKTSILATKLVEELFNKPMITVTAVAELLQVTHHTAQNHVDRLVTAGILRPLDERKRNRVYVADSIVQTIYEASSTP